jgi:hypothetical protein
MALKTVSKSQVGNTIKAAKMEVGAFVEGYLKQIEESQQYPGQYSFIMVNKETSELFRLSGAGNLKYLVADGLVQEGIFTRITRLEDRKNKRGMTVSNFELAQDDEDTLAASGITPTASASTSDDDGDIPAEISQPGPNDMKKRVQAAVAAKATEVAKNFAANRRTK